MMPDVKPDRTMAACGSIAFGALAFGLALGLGAAALQATNAAPAETACQKRLTPDRAVFKAIGEVDGPGACGGPDVVQLERIVLADRNEIAVEPPATLRCEMAEALTYFVRQDLAPLASRMGAALAAIENYDSYDCRGRNRVSGAKLSEHGRANALDIRSLRLKDGRVVRPASDAAPPEFRLAMKAAVCTRFATVLGPGSDGYHEDHIHVDLAERSGGRRMCQWDLHDGAHPDAVAAHAGAEGIPYPVPLPRSRPFVDAGASRAIQSPAESRH